MNNTLKEVIKRSSPIYRTIEDFLKNKSNKKEQVAFIVYMIEDRLNEIVSFAHTNNVKEKLTFYTQSLESDVEFAQIYKDLYCEHAHKIANFAKQIIDIVRNKKKVDIAKKAYLLSIANSAFKICRFHDKKSNFMYGYALSIGPATSRIFEGTIIDDIVKISDGLHLKTFPTIPNKTKKDVLRMLQDYIFIAEPYFEASLSQRDTVYLKLDLSRPTDELIELVKQLKEEYKKNEQLFESPVKKIFGDDFAVVKFDETSIEKMYGMRDNSIPFHIKLTTIIYILDCMMLEVRTSVIESTLYEYYNYTLDLDISLEAVRKQVANFKKRAREWLFIIQE